jgi:hypothetical protein
MREVLRILSNCLRAKEMGTMVMGTAAFKRFSAVFFLRGKLAFLGLDLMAGVPGGRKRIVIFFGL